MSATANERGIMAANIEDIRYWCTNALQTFSCTRGDPCLHQSYTGTKSGYSCQVHRLARTILSRIGDGVTADSQLHDSSCAIVKEQEQGNYHTDGLCTCNSQ